jgi:hypothetical protein
VPAKNTEDGIRAVKGAKVIEPESVRRYLEGKFQDDLKAVRLAMTKLAEVFKPKELEENAYKLYEQFRPAIPRGVKGWGAKGKLDLGLIEGLTRHKK